MPNTINNAPKRRSLFGGRAGRNGPGGHWVTIHGSHVFIQDAKGELIDDPLSVPFPRWPFVRNFDQGVGDATIKMLNDPPELSLPPSQRPPDENPSAWERNVEQTQISPFLGTVHNLGLIIFGETQSYSDRPDSNEPIDIARQKLAHAVMNADEMWGADRTRNASTALPIEPSEKALGNPTVRAAYESSMKAAREAYLSGTDPTDGAVFLDQKTNASRANSVMSNSYPQGVRLSTQSGPYNNSFPNSQVPSRTAWLNTYYPKGK